jgi:hypothetical protein
VHCRLDFVADGFEWMALEVNTRQTVFMTYRLKFRSTNILYSAKLQAQLHDPKYRERWNKEVECEICGEIVQNQSLKRHCIHVHPELLGAHEHPSLWTPEPMSQPDQDWTVLWAVTRRWANNCTCRDHTRSASARVSNCHHGCISTGQKPDTTEGSPSLTSEEQIQWMPASDTNVPYANYG